jgi:hypothetical protein
MGGILFMTESKIIDHPSGMNDDLLQHVDQNVLKHDT